MSKIVKVRSNGIHSCVMTLPIGYRKELGISDGDYVKVTKENNKMIIEKV